MIGVELFRPIFGYSATALRCFWGSRIDSNWLASFGGRPPSLALMWAHTTRNAAAGNRAFEWGSIEIRQGSGLPGASKLRNQRAP